MGLAFVQTSERPRAGAVRTDRNVCLTLSPEHLAGGLPFAMRCGYQSGRGVARGNAAGLHCKTLVARQSQDARIRAVVSHAHDSPPDFPLVKSASAGASERHLMKRILVSLLAFLAAASGAFACSIPVFRYALDRWQADPFALEISATDAKDEAVARFLRNLTDSSPLNLSPSRSDDEGFSHLAFPHAAPDATPAWSGKLDGTTLPRITDSPARAEIVKRILAGECGVWVLVESGQRDADDRATATLEKRLRYLEQVAQIPQIDPSDPTSQLGPGPALRVKFSLLRITRDNVDEEAFTAMLAGPNHDMENANGPWLALVFGRGRVLGAWAAEGFGDEQTDEACLFLLGACSCEVKRMNPGWDLLVNVDWNESLHAMGFPPPPPATLQKPMVAAQEPGAAKPEPEKPEAPKPETVTIAAAPASATPGRGAITPTIIAAAVLLVLGSALAWRTIRRA